MTKEVREMKNVVECGICGRDINLDNEWYIETEDNGIICEDCHCDHYVVCNECGELLNIDTDTYYSDDWNCYCEHCVPARIQYADLVEYYHDGHDGRYSRVLRHDNDSDNFTIGFELERDGYENEVYENADELAALKSDGLVHFERDGSLNDGGIECISQPFSYTWLQANKGTFERIINTMSNNSGWYHSETSFHIHIGREAFTDDTAIAKVCYFYKAFPEAVASLSNRRFNDWAERIQGTLKNVADGYHYSNRYQAVNLSNSNTVEFRLMGGSEDSEELLRWIEFHYQLINRANNIRWAVCGDIESWLEGFSDNIVGAMAKNKGLTGYLGNTVAPFVYNAHIQIYDRNECRWVTLTQYNENGYKPFEDREDITIHCRRIVRDILGLEMDSLNLRERDDRVLFESKDMALYVLDCNIKKTNLLYSLAD